MRIERYTDAYQVLPRSSFEIEKNYVRLPQNDEVSCGIICFNYLHKTNVTLKLAESITNCKAPFDENNLGALAEHYNVNLLVLTNNALVMHTYNHGSNFYPMIADVNAID